MRTHTHTHINDTAPQDRIGTEKKRKEKNRKEKKGKEPDPNPKSGEISKLEWPLTSNGDLITSFRFVTGDTPLAVYFAECENAILVFSKSSRGFVVVNVRKYVSVGRSHFNLAIIQMTPHRIAGSQQ